MNKFIKFMVVLALAISLPLEGFAAVLPTCALMSHSDTKMTMPAQQAKVQADVQKFQQQDCKCDFKQMASKACGQSVNCSGCVIAVAAMFNHVSVALSTTDVYLNGPQIHGPPLFTTSIFRPPIIASA